MTLARVLFSSFVRPGSGPAPNRCFRRICVGTARRGLFSSPTRSSLNGDGDATTLFLSNVYPDSSASAAGVRTRSLMDRMAEISTVQFATGAKAPAPSASDDQKGGANANWNPNPSTRSSSCPQDILNELQFQNNIAVSSLPPNRSDRMQDFALQSHSKQQLDTVVFDRFYVEEAYSFAFYEHFPDATMVLDMQDMHSLRWGREQLVRAMDTMYPNNDDPFACLEQVVAYTPTTDNPHLLRELASIHRTDLTLVCSPYELELLQTIYQIPPHKLCLASFFVDDTQRMMPPPPPVSSSAADPPHYVFCGGFRHAPNLDAVRILLRHVWPRIRQQLPTAQLHIHGAYCPQEITQYHHTPNRLGIHVHGFTPNLDDIFGRGGILLAPLRFGAGIKGKIVDAWTFGMPVVTTPIGSEGMMANDSDDNYDDSSSLLFGGRVAPTLKDFCAHAVELAIDQTAYQNAQEAGRRLLGHLYHGQRNWGNVHESLMETKRHLTERRRSDYTRAMLWHHSNRSTEYFSRWIELKEQQTTQRDDHDSNKK